MNKIIRKNSKIPNNFFIFELANNHMGDIGHALKIIDEYAKIKKKFPNFNFGFKLQFRNLNTFIHKDKKSRSDLHYIKRFNETRLSNNEYKKIISHIKKRGFLSIVTPFDESSVDLIKKLKVEIIKVASCSFNDWQLLEKITENKLPIIASTAGATLKEIENVVSFFENRKKEFVIMHCVGEYPTPNKKLNLIRLKYLKEKYPYLNIGYSTHEDPNETNIISMAISSGATIFEKHIGLETDKYKLNKYSANPYQVYNWLKAAKKSFEIFGSSKDIFKKNNNELKSLNSLKRGLFAKKNIKKNTKLKSDDFYLAFPPEKNQVLADKLSKYNEITSKTIIKKDGPITFKNCKIYNSREKIYQIINKANKILKKCNHTFLGPIDYEISHHYGMQNFKKFGIVLLNIINGIYCKKILVLFKNQTHPQQFHKTKRETFHILHGSIKLKLNNNVMIKNKGDIITIEPKVKHEFFSISDSVIEEISSTHFKADSYYTDPRIQKNQNRKTNVKFVWE